MPNKFSSLVVILRSFCFLTPATISMYGLFSSSSNHSDTCSLRTPGAKGRKLSRYLTFKLSCFCISECLGSAIILLAPKALGPNSIRPCIHPTAFFFTRADTTLSIKSSFLNFLKTAPHDLS